MRQAPQSTVHTPQSSVNKNNKMWKISRMRSKAAQDIRRSESYNFEKSAERCKAHGDKIAVLVQCTEFK